MCTALKHGHFFGRNLDYESSYGEEITITPRNFNYHFRFTKVKTKYALIGMAHIYENYPLYYDAMNEKGLAIAGLNFVGNTKFYTIDEKKENVAPFELIPWLLCQCKDLKEVKEKLKDIQIVNEAFNSYFPIASLHYMVSDLESSLVIECMEDGMHIHENPFHVLSNNPPFPYQQMNLNNYMHLSSKQPENQWNATLAPYSRGMGAIGLPGDASSMSRFVRASFLASQSTQQDCNQFFHLLHGVEQVKGICEVKENTYEYTIYTSCCDQKEMIYYYSSYDNHQINAVTLFHENLDGSHLIAYPLINKEQINRQN